MATNVRRKTHEDLFLEATPKKVFWQAWVNLVKNLSHPKNVPAPAPMIDTATRWVYGWSRLITGYKQDEVADVKLPQNLQLHSKTALKPQKTGQHWANYDKKQAMQQISRLPGC